MDIKPHDYVGPFRIIAKIGSGGMASVYQAVDTRTDDVVALKVLLEQFSSKPSIIERFQREADIVQRLKHPHIVNIRSHGMIDGVYFIAMEYMAKGSLADLFETPHTVPLKVLSQYLIDIAGALGHAHDAGIVHRDIKLANVLLDANDRVGLSDFGIARLVQATTLTQTGITVGTPHYMAPEQIESARTVDHRADIYSLAVMAFLFVAGRYPFVGDSPLQIMYQHINDNTPSPGQYNPSLPPVVEDVIMRGMAKNPDERYQSAIEFANDFKQAIHDIPTDMQTYVQTQIISSQDFQRYSNKITTSSSAIESSGALSFDAPSTQSRPPSIPAKPTKSTKQPTLDETYVLPEDYQPGDAHYSPQPVVAPSQPSTAKKRRALLPLLVIIFMVSVVAIGLFALQSGAIFPVDPTQDSTSVVDATQDEGNLATSQMPIDASVTIAVATDDVPSATAQTTDSVVLSPTATATASVTASDEPTATDTATATATASDEPTATDTPSETPTVTNQPDATSTIRVRATPVRLTYLPPSNRVVVVGAQAVNIRTEPSLRSRVFDVAQPGETLQVLVAPTNINWIGVLQNGRMGWISSNLVDFETTSGQAILDAWQPVSSNDGWQPLSALIDGVSMVLVPAGCFDMGVDLDIELALCSQRLNADLCEPKWYEDEIPQHEICFDEPFWIDQYEVSNRVYDMFLPGNAVVDELPMVGLTWHDARAFCSLRGGRLPTDAEWEYAAAGPDSLRYPWGDVFVANGNFCDTNCTNESQRDERFNDRVATLATVYSFANGDSWVGTRNMSGNIWEWTQTIYDKDEFPYPYVVDDGRNAEATEDERRTIRSGSYFYHLGTLLTTARDGFPVSSTTRDLGVRCVLDIEAVD